MSAVLDASSFQQQTNVSRETLERLTLFAALLQKWQKSINLVSNRSLDDLWQRHFFDSAQLAPLITKTAAEMGKETPNCVDMGSGGGFPALVLAIMGAGQWTLVESDTRKCVFLNEVARQCEISATIINQRLEKVTDLQADIVTARAFAPLERLLGHAHAFMGPESAGIFLKGQNLDAEVKLARERWAFDEARQSSQSDDDGQILIIKHLEPC